MGKLIVRIASLLLIAAFLPTAVLAAEWNLENGSIEITATANAAITFCPNPLTIP